MTHAKETNEIIKAFLPDMQIDGVQRLAIGHINPSYIVRYLDHGAAGTIFLQQINAHVFQNPPSVIQNIQRVTTHIHAKLVESRCVEPERKVLHLMHAPDGQPFVIDSCGRFWRAYRYIDGTYCINTVETAQQARAAAYAFGNFTRQLADLPAPPLIETIENFHDTHRRFEDFLNAAIQDPLGRAADATREIEFARSRESGTQVLMDLQRAGLLPMRSVHNDTKINNVLFDAKSDEALCVVDLDTVMPGLVAHDLGDLVRSSIGDHAEDESDVGLVRLRMPIFAVLLQGYLEGTRGLLTDSELDSLLIGVRVIPLELGLRFLGDHLQGDRYFKAKWPSQNLQRARVQFRLVELMERNKKQMQSIMDKHRNEVLCS